jgi:hypothetical protein
MSAADMTMEVGPAQAGKVTGCIGTVVSKEEDSVANYVLVYIADTNVVVGTGYVIVGVVFISLRGVIGEDDERCNRLQTNR